MVTDRQRSQSRNHPNHYVIEASFFTGFYQPFEITDEQPRSRDDLESHSRLLSRRASQSQPADIAVILYVTFHVQLRCGGKSIDETHARRREACPVAA